MSGSSFLFVSGVQTLVLSVVHAFRAPRTCYHTAAPFFNINMIILSSSMLTQVFLQATAGNSFLLLKRKYGRSSPSARRLSTRSATQTTASSPSTTRRRSVDAQRPALLPPLRLSDKCTKDQGTTTPPLPVTRICSMRARRQQHSWSRALRGRILA